MPGTSRGAWLVLLAVAFAGCAESAPKAIVAPSPSAAAPTADAATGSVTGVVTDEEVVAIRGAAVALLPLALETTTDDAGRFTLNDVEPGEYDLYVQRVGYEAAARKVSVAAGEVLEVKVQLRAILLDKEWHYTETTARDMIAGSYVAAAPNDAQTWALRWTLKDDPLALQDLFLEADWNPSTALGDGIRFWAGIGTWNSAASLCKEAGFDPYTCHPTKEQLAQDWACDFREDSKSCRAEWMFRPGGSRVSSQLVGVWPQDKVTVYVSHFFRMPAPSDFTALKDPS